MWTLVSGTSVQQGRRLTFKCCLSTQLFEFPIGRSFAINLVINSFCLKDLSVLARRILVQHISAEEFESLSQSFRCAVVSRRYLLKALMQFNIPTSDPISLRSVSNPGIIPPLTHPFPIWKHTIQPQVYMFSCSK